MDNFVGTALTVCAACAGAVLGIAIKSPDKYLTLLNSARRGMEHTATFSIGVMVGAFLAGATWGLFVPALPVLAFGLLGAGQLIAQALGGADLAKKREGRQDVSGQDKDE